MTFFSAHRPVCWNMWQNMLESDWPQLTILCGTAKTLLVCGITKSRIDTCNLVLVYYCVNVLVLIAFLQQFWLHERASLLRYTCTSYVTHYSNVYGNNYYHYNQLANMEVGHLLTLSFLKSVALLCWAYNRKLR
jgi:hypothetical protein